MAAVPGAAGPSGAAGTPRSTSGDLWLVSWLRQWTYPTEGFLVGVARSQLVRGPGGWQKAAREESDGDGPGATDGRRCGGEAERRRSQR